MEGKVCAPRSEPFRAELKFNLINIMKIINRLSWLLLTLGITTAAMAQSGTRQLDVRDFGAKGDGTHIDSPALNAALEKAAQDGGGIVVVPQGVYMCHSIHLQSGVTLRIDDGAVIKAAPVTDEEGYDEAEHNDWTDYQDFGHSHWHNSLLWGEKLQDVVLEGKGLIEGCEVLTRGGRPRGASGPSVANKALALRECSNVTVRDLRFLECGHFALLLTGVDNLILEDLTIDTNRDGIDIDCCENVIVRGCRVNTVNDDAIVLKCSYALGYPKPTANVIIEDCAVSGYDIGSFLDGSRTTLTEKAPDGDGPTGRIKLGTESNGGFRNILIRRCSFNHCRGLALESVDGAAMENIEVSDLTMHDICNSPIYIRLGSRMRAPEGFPESRVDGISIRNVKVTDADSRYACLIAGMPDNPVRNVRIEDLSVEFRGGLTLDDVRQQRGANPFFFGGDGKARINRGWEKGGYPEPSAHGIQPSWGFSISNAEDICLRRVQLSTLRPDERPWLHRENTPTLQLSEITVNGEPEEI